MKKCVFLVLQLIFLSLVISCSDSDEKSSVEEKQEQIGHDAADAIKAPMDKASDVQAVVDKHYAEKEEQTEQ